MPYREHVFDRPCWCGPTEEQPCLLCEGDGCAACRDGWHRPYSSHPFVVTLVTHHDPGEALAP